MLENYALIKNTDFTCFNGYFISLSAPSGGSIYFDSTSSKLTLTKCSFFANRAETCGGAVAIGKCDSFILFLSCFASNTAYVGHDIYQNVIRINCMKHFDIKSISEIGGKSNHGSIFGSSTASSYRDANMTLFEGQRAYWVHFSNAEIAMSHVVASNCTTNIFISLADTSTSPIKFNRVVAVHAGNVLIEGSPQSFSIEDSVFVFGQTPTPIPVVVTVLRSVSNVPFGACEVIPNPQTPQFHLRDCFEILPSAIHERSSRLVFVLSAEVISLE